jgi:2-polyprenyl-6-methoxyphenol hydroxylase-like FAD-dependent oxidoreductase
MPYLEHQPRILIAGAGIGGLSAALALHASGYTNVQIFEASSQLTTLGVGINVQPSAVLILRNLGLLEALEKTGIQTQELNFYNRHGDSILSEKRGKQAGYEVPQFSIHRGEFQMLLLSAVKERLGDETLHLNHALTGFEQDEKSITAQFSQRRDGAPASQSSVTGDILIAADGINSTARRILYPNEGPPKFSGRMLWRGCIERVPYLTGASMVWAGHADQKFIAYPISQRSADKGKSLVNWIAELRIREKTDEDVTPPKTDWTKAVNKNIFAGPFESWRCGGLEMKDLINRTEKVFEFPMSDRDPVEHWSFGRLTLLGDAAHAMVMMTLSSQLILDLLRSLRTVPHRIERRIASHHRRGNTCQTYFIYKSIIHVGRRSAESLRAGALAADCQDRYGKPCKWTGSCAAASGGTRARWL